MPSDEEAVNAFNFVEKAEKIKPFLLDLINEVNKVDDEDKLPMLNYVVDNLLCETKISLGDIVGLLESTKLRIWVRNSQSVSLKSLMLAGEFDERERTKEELEKYE